VAIGSAASDADYTLQADTGLTLQYLMTSLVSAETYWFKV
jgi:hypothetical protein